jgi:alkylation response protein AidB-like acyl-CoA dehydrogenase
MTEQAIEDAVGIDEADVEALRESIAAVLADQSGGLAVHAFVDGEGDLETVLWGQAAALGWMAVALPEEFGGFGLGAIGSRVLNIELGRVVAPGPYIASLAAAQAFAEAADPDIRDTWLPRIVAGQIGIAIAAAEQATPSVRQGPLGLSGTLTLLGPADAAVALIPFGEAGLAVVDMADLGAAPANFWDRTRALVDVALTDVHPLAIITQGAAARRALNRAFSISVAADCIGLSHGIAAKTIHYMKERSQFGRAIGSFQALKHRVVDLIAKIGIAEQVLAQAVESAAAGDVIADMWAALAKAIASEAAVFIAGDCVQLHGGVGYTWEFDVHLYLKRARLNEMLVADNRRLRDQAAAALAQATRAGQSTLELPLI